MKLPAMNFIKKLFAQINVTCPLNFLDPSLYSKVWHAERNLLGKFEIERADCTRTISTISTSSFRTNDVSYY